SYNGKETLALSSLSLEIPEASAATILGRNGSGKTTLLFVLLGMLPPHKGTILFDGKSRGEHQACGTSCLTGLVPQEEHIPFEFSVREYVLLGRAPHLGILQTPDAQDYHIAQHAIETTGLGPCADRPVSSLSGGERQLATIARAVAQRPRVLLLDEPTSHLDLNNTQCVLGLVRRLADDGVTVVLTTHDPNTAVAVADFAVLLRQGATVAAGSAAEVMTSYNLSATYGIPVDVAYLQGRSVVLPLAPSRAAPCR
ncbi:MAG: ABC transporter ATP-binding protein, partial [Anaerolineae bacterium]|nr:ABC transporter ATP-binding protein [Anaerolineae bacterium]